MAEILVADDQVCGCVAAELGIDREAELGDDRPVEILHGQVDSDLYRRG
jgi:hypothetical protein